MASTKFGRIFCRFPITFCIQTNSRTHLATYFNKYSTNSNFKSKPKRSSLFLGIVGLSAGALVGAGYSYFTAQKSGLPIPNKGVGSTCPILKSLPDVAVTRKVVNEADNSGLKLVLFQYPTCPFCCKVRACLDFYGISYDVVEVSPLLRKQIKWSEYKKVPILLAKVEGGYQQMNDSSMIISAIASYLYDKNSNLAEIVNCFPSISYSDDKGVKNEIMNRYFLMFQGESIDNRTDEEILDERKWRKWVDEVLVHTLSPNVYRTKEEALQSFNWYSEVGEWDKLFSKWEKSLIVYFGAFAMYFIGKRLKKRHSLKEDVRQSLYDECNYWLNNLKRKGTPYCGGDRPNLADLAVYGVLCSMEGCEAFQDLLHNTNIGTWYFNMKKIVRNIQVVYQAKAIL